jgi:hypothetical protein
MTNEVSSLVTEVFLAPPKAFPFFIIFHWSIFIFHFRTTVIIQK